MKKNKYDNFYVKQEMQNGVRSCDLVLERSRSDIPIIGNFLRDRICDITQGIISHAFLIGKSGDIIEINQTGVHITKLKPKLNNKMGLLVFRNNNITEEEKDKMLSYAYMTAQKKTGYDFAGLLSHLFPFIRQDNKLFYCSEFCATAFSKINVRVSSRSVSVTTPQDLLDYQYLYGAFADNVHGWELADSQNMSLPAVADFQAEKYK